MSSFEWAGEFIRIVAAWGFPRKKFDDDCCDGESTIEQSRVANFIVDELNILMVHSFSQHEWRAFLRASKTKFMIKSNVIQSPFMEKMSSQKSIESQVLLNVRTHWNCSVQSLTFLPIIDLLNPTTSSQSPLQRKTFSERNTIAISTVPTFFNTKETSFTQI